MFFHIKLSKHKKKLFYRQIILNSFILKYMNSNSLFIDIFTLLNVGIISIELLLSSLMLFTQICLESNN